MTILNPKELKAQAKDRLSASRADTRLLVLIYCGVLAALTLASNGLQLYLNSQISTTGGLSGLGLRSTLQTIQSVLGYVNLFFGPFWQAGFLFAMIGLVRGQEPGPKSLTEGFRRFARVLSYALLGMVLAFLVAMAAVYAASLLFTFTPWGMSFAEALGPALTDGTLLAADGTINMDLIPREAVMAAAPPMMVLFLVIFVPAYGFLSYSLRMSTYLLMEGGRIGAVQAMVISSRMMKGHRWQMLKLDLSYWWYYALVFLASAVGYLDTILELAGIPVSMDPMVMYFGTLVLYCLLDLGISLWKKCEVDATYVLAYEAIAHSVRSEITIPSDPNHAN